ncbi:MAG: cation:proton antiporter [Phycisphaerae bacterium]|nr:cation:proton antiporter [Phycisphaerae bacterium]
MHYLDEMHIFLFLAQVFVLLALARGLGELFRKWGQPALTAELLVGVLVGPTILGRFAPVVHQWLFPVSIVQETMLDTVAWLGLLFLLLTIGFEIDFSVAWRQRGRALTIAVADIVIPMVIAFVPCLFLPAHYLVESDQRVVFALFMATVMTISAMPVAAKVLHDMNLLKADVGFLIVSALAVNDLMGWVLFTIVLGLFAQATVAIGSVLAVFAGTVGMAGLALWLGPGMATRALDRLHRRKLPEPGTSLTFACLLALLFGAVTQKLGIHALFGFFIAGVVMGEAKNLSEQTRGIISEMVHAVFVPLFFATIGLKIDFAAHFDWFLVLFMCVIGIAGRYVGAWIGVSLTKAPRINRDLISIAHTAGGMMEIVVAVLALETGLITPQVFVAIVLSAVVSCMIMGPWMRAAMVRRAAAGLMNFMTRDSLVAAMAATDRAEAIGELSDKVAVRAGVPSAKIAEAAMTREVAFGTGVGYGVAIPHVRMDAVKNPVVAIGRAPQGLDWNAPDGQPVSRVFFLLTPADVHDVHAQLLAEVARAMQDPENRRRFDEARAPALWETLRDLFPKGDVQGKRRRRF